MGTTTNKLSYLTETKEKIAEKIIDLGGDITDNTTFREYANELQTIYDNTNKVNVEGSNIKLQECVKGKMVIQPKGNTIQNITTGKNLFNINNYIIKESNIGFDISKLIVGQQYTFSSKLPITWFKISTNAGGYISVQNHDSNGFNNFTFTMTRNSNIPEENTQYLFIGVNGLNAIKDINDLNGYNIQLETGSTATDYEPYTGGTASPNPEYPQTIKNVTGNNKVKIKELLLPDEYQQVEYIESTGTQYINPEIITDLNEVYWYVKFALTELKGSGPYNGYNCILGLDNNPQIAAYQNGWTVGNNGSNLPYPPQINVKYEATLNKNGNGGLNIDGQATGISRFINSVTPTIFDINANASKAKIYNVKYIRLSDNVVLNNFVPCYRKSDDEIGMYDIVNDIFYTNAGTGTFLKGEDYPIIEKELNLISKNVLQLKKNYTWTSNGITVSTGNDDIITINGTVSSNLNDSRIFLFNNHYYVEAGETYAETIKYISGTITPSSTQPNHTGLLYLRNSDTESGFEYQFNSDYIGFLKTQDMFETITVVNTGVKGRNGYINSMQLMAQQGTVFSNYKIKIQLEKNHTPTEYEPYYNYELCKIGDYQDYFYKDYNKGKWYLHKIIYNNKFSANAVITLEEGTIGTNHHFQIHLGNNGLPKSLINKGFSNYFQFAGRYDYFDYPTFYIEGGWLWINDKNGYFVDKNALKAFFIEYEPEFIYPGNIIESKEPKETEIEITQQPLINQLESLNRTIIQVPTINIETESDVDNAQLIVNASALKSS